jgi:hypothetical protein
MGSSQSIQKINYEDIQYILKNKNSGILINTLREEEQDCLIINTVDIHKEVELINRFIKNSAKHIKIIIYGKNANDEKIYEKYSQLGSLGFYNIYIYPGGLFEWLLLQDIYGANDFPTTKKELDILKYKPNKILNVPLLEY